MDKNVIKQIFRSPPVRYTERMILRPIAIRDLDDIYEYSCDGEVTKYLTWEPHTEKRMTKKHIKNVLDAYENGRFYDWALELKSSGKMIGTCGFTSFSYVDDSCEIGYVINPRYHGYALATEAALCVIGFAFETLGAKRVFARCMPQNTASRRVMEKCGMTFVREEKNTVIKQNRYVTVFRFAIEREKYYLIKQLT